MNLHFSTSFFPATNYRRANNLREDEPTINEDGFFFVLFKKLGNEWIFQ